MKHLNRLLILSLLISFWLPALSADAKNDFPSGPIWLSAGNEEQPGQNPQTNVSAPQKNALDITISFSGVWADQQTNDGQTFTRLWHPEYGNYREPGEPALPGTTFNVLIPDGVTVEVIHSKISSNKIDLGTYNLPKMIVPAQVQASKSEQPPPWTQPDPLKYAQITPYPENWYALNPILKMRDYTILPIWVNPARYQPAKGEVELLQQIELRLSWDSVKIDTTQSTMKGDSPSFDRLVSQLVINPPELPVYDTKSDVREGYLIITPDEFVEALQPIVEMKENQGYDVKVTKLSEIDGIDGDQGDVLLIQNHINSFNPPPVFLLLVGDTNLIPAPEGDITKLKTDLYYATLDNEDYIPDILIGRLPVRTELDVINQVNKLLSYTNNGFHNYYMNSSFIATCDTKFNSESGIQNFQIAEGSHNYVINHHTSLLNYPGDYPEDLLPLGGDQLYCITHDAETSDITLRISEGRGLITYSGHGFVTGWVDGKININSEMIPFITEENKYSFVSSFACYTNDFGNNQIQSSFGETWLLQQNKGAIGFIGSAAPSYWNQDNEFEITMFDHQFINPIDPPTIRESINIGLLSLQANYSNLDAGGFQYYLESYNLLGDPSQKLWLVPSNRVFMPVIFK